MHQVCRKVRYITLLNEISELSVLADQKDVWPAVMVTTIRLCVL